MRDSTIGTDSRISAKISDSLQNVVLHSIRNVVSDELIERISRGGKWGQSPIKPEGNS